ncbi:hypothetical protein HZ326_27349 [Fusarium oxysporum f. sp. albedinis]|nr:hypothetical protein HZ326_27349 [Fusarium oxysporum f. sp. albedinis]
MCGRVLKEHEHSLIHIPLFIPRPPVSHGKVRPVPGLTCTPKDSRRDLPLDFLVASMLAIRQAMVNASKLWIPEVQEDICGRRTPR